ncbi:restriction modification system DNA specificity subunit [Listeria seeligeri FSL S4-171]|uniref:restriction endonuclease subunit S n=1 Tax=Listeria seeligeri TaxID=1640 RepID=UPI0001EB7A3A|nr:restriction endonuclease subunit S [Listeria seeligeri]EFS04448.1 restriction modification system DNA specificity subunit [Listeria seeligeri FSL S4-171]
MSDSKKNAPKRRFEEFSNANDWEQRKLGGLMNITSVKRIHQSDWTDKGVRFLRARDIVSASKGKNPSEYLYISKKLYDEHSKISGKVGVGDLLVTGVGSIGIPMLIKHEEPLYFKDGNIIWFQNKKNIDGGFFYYSFNSHSIQKFIRDSAGIGTVGTYTIDSGGKTPIYLPNKKEQQRIGTFFKQLDNTIALHQRKLEKIKALKTAYLSEMFPAEGELKPRRRFAGFTDDWEQRKLMSVFEFPVSTNSLSRSQLNYDNGEIKSVHYGDILVNYDSILEIAKDRIPFITNGVIDKYKPNLLENGDLIFADAAEDETVGKAVEVDGKTNEYIVAGLHTIVARPRRKMAKFFWGYYINSSIYHNQLLRLMQGTKVASISKSNLQKTCIAYPDNFAEQQKLGNFFKQLDNTITLHQRKLKKLQNIKKAYLNEMFI